MAIRMLVFLLVCATVAGAQPNFTAQVVDDDVEIGYGLAIGDVDGDKRPDILLADKKQFVWYRNGDWKRFVMIDNLTPADNVCIAARDCDGDGKVEIAVGAQWNPGETSDTTKSGSVHVLRRPKDPTQKWQADQLHHEPTVHRMRWVNTGNGFQLVVVPLHGRNNKNGQGSGVRVIAYEQNAGKWKYMMIDSSMHLTHNFDVIPSGTSEHILIGGKEGARRFAFDGKKWSPVGKSSWIAAESFGEIRVGTIGRESIIAGIQPMHGNQLAVFSSAGKTVLTDSLSQGHALAVADVLGLGYDQVVAGWREPDANQKVGIVLFQPASSSASSTWKKFWVDENKIACEDLLVADLDGDGKKEIIAAGRSSHNLKIYWNK